MEETEQQKSGRRKPKHLHDSGLYYRSYPTPLLPLLPLPPPILLHQYHQRQYQYQFQQYGWTHHPISMAEHYHHQQSSLWKQKKDVSLEATLLEAHVATVIPVPRAKTMASKAKPTSGSQAAALVVARRPDNGGQDGRVISLLANHFLVEFDPSQKIYHYDVDIFPRPSKELARMIKRKLVEENPIPLSGSLPVFDGRRSLYSPVDFQADRLEFFVNLPIPSTTNATPSSKGKVFRVNVKLVSKLNGQNLNKYLNNKNPQEEGEDDDGNGVLPLPQDYLQALDIALREFPAEKCVAMGRSLYSSSMEGGAKDIGSGVIGLRGFFQSLRPTQQGLVLNVDFSVMAFHEGIGVIPYLQKHCKFLGDLTQRKNRVLVGEEKREVEKALRNIRVFVCHRNTDERYRVHSLTDEITENLRFKDRDGKELKVVDYYKEVYDHDIQFRSLPCLQISRSKKACYLPMELCVVCEGQKFLGKLSDDQTARILRMGCQKPRERREIIDGVMRGEIGPTCGSYASGFNLKVSPEMTCLQGRVLQPPKLKLGDGGHVRHITPNRKDRQWNLQDSHVTEGTKIKRWALISFGGSKEQHLCISKFITQLILKCEKLGIHLDRKTVVSSSFEQAQVLNNVSVLESKIRKIHEAAGGKLQLLVCVLEKKHKGYADLKRIAETSVGVVSQCCLYSNLAKLGSQFLVNLALKINAKVGGCNVVLYKTLPFQIPRLFADNEPVMLMGADVTHPHPLDDSSPSVAAVVGSMNWPAANKYVSRMRSQTHRQEIIEDLEEMTRELLDGFRRGNSRKLPGRILFFRDGVSETQFHRVLQEELQAIRRACGRFDGYKPTITFTVVQKRHHTRLFPNDGLSVSDENVPPGTVVDTLVTHPREFDFYLCSHWGMKGTSRPTHYHVLWDENLFRSDELQKLVHNLCYTFARCTKPVSLVPPAYYAHLAAYRGRLYLDRSDGAPPARTSKLSRCGPPTRTLPLPELQDSLKNLMFYC